MNKSVPHCPSYYAATRNDDTCYPPLRGEVGADVCVIGSGFTGIAAALTLAERGYKVAVVEQHSVGWGASGRNGGQIIAGLAGADNLYKFWGESHADTLFELGYRGHDIIRQRARQYGIECDLKSGYVDVAVKPGHVEQQKRWHQTLCEYGMESQVHLVSAQQMPGLLGTDKYLGGLVNDRNGHFHPLNFCLGEARAAAGLGVSIYENSEVTGIEHGPRPLVKTSQGSVRAKFVILAGNAYHFLESKRLGGLVFPASTYIIASEPLSEQEVASINPQDLAVCDQSEVEDYFRLSADRRMLFGGRCDASGREPRSIEGAMLPRMLRIYPQLAHKRVDYAWGGKIGIVVNRIPLMGRIGGNVFYSQGYSGHGVNMAHVCGEMLADAVAGTSERMDIFSRVPHRKIPFGQKIGNQVVAMGLLYHRLRDLM